ncbi:putative esterase [Hyaloraphidium curvatum]|nr:putative esterase [Hyaloraphidium curvatum]
MAGVPQTFVLVHGAWHGGWCWRQTARILSSRGHSVFTPTNTGLADRSHLLEALGPKITLDTFVTDIVNLLHFEDLKDVTLVGHSFGGAVISGVADRARERIRRLIYLDSLILEGGISPLDSLGPEVKRHRTELAMQTSGGLSLPPPNAEALGIHDPELGRLVESKLTPHPFATYDTPLNIKGPVGNGLPATYITCIDPIYPPLSGSRAFAKEASSRGWRLAEIATGHDAMITAPVELADLLEKEGEAQ